MTDDTKKTDLGSLAESSYDQSKGRLSVGKDENPGLASGPQDSVTGKISETPTEPDERASEAVERAQKRE